MTRKDLVKEYKELMLIQAEHARIAALAKQRMNEIEADLFEATKKQGAIVVDKVVFRYIKSSKTTHGYSALWQHALKVVDEDLKKQLEDYQEANKRINDLESLEVIDADFVTATKGLNKLSLEELLISTKLELE